MIKIIKESAKDDLQGTFKYTIPSTVDYEFDEDDLNYLIDGWCDDYIVGAYIIDGKLIKDKNNSLVITFDYEIEDPSEISKKQVIRGLNQAIYDYLKL